MHEAMKLCYDPPMTNISASQYEASLGTYIDQGMQTAESLGNRGPIRFDAEGKLAPDILEAYWRTGFYVFEGLIKKSEIQLQERIWNHCLIAPRSTTARRLTIKVDPPSANNLRVVFTH